MPFGNSGVVRKGEGRQGVRCGSGPRGSRRADHRAAGHQHLPGAHPGVLRRHRQRHTRAYPRRGRHLEPQGHQGLLRERPHRLRGQGQIDHGRATTSTSLDHTPQGHLRGVFSLSRNPVTVNVRMSREYFEDHWRAHLACLKSALGECVVRYYFTVTDFAKFLGLSGSSFFSRAI